MAAVHETFGPQTRHEKSARDLQAEATGIGGPPLPMERTSRPV